MKLILQQRAFFLSFQTEWELSKRVIFYTIAYEGLLKYQILVFYYSKSVSCTNSKCLDFASVQVKHIVKKCHFFLIPNRMWKWVIFDTMAYQRLLKYQTSFSLFKASELWKFQMSRFCITTGETQFKTGHFFSHAKRNEKMSHVWHSDIQRSSKISN